jgi:serine/alanine adding enzyme
LSDTDASKYNDLLLNYFEKIGIVAHFCLLTPFLGSQERQLLQLNKKLTFRKNVAIIDLRRAASDLWSNIDEAQRKAVWHARKSGIEVKVSDLSCADLDSFYQLYIQNMARVEATAFWHFPKSFFHETVNCLSKDNVTLMNALLNGEVISSFFLIHMYDKVFYHFSAAVHKHRKLNANALLMFDCMMWAKAAGFNFFYLGGGSTSEADSLFRFKNSFANNTLELFSSEVVVNKETYEGLVKAAKVEEKRAFGKELVTDFFPRYRAR